jgi:hypothetical protein
MRVDLPTGLAAGHAVVLFTGKVSHAARAATIGAG